jgi:metallo-beta-lactamase class B
MRFRSTATTIVTGLLLGLPLHASSQTVEDLAKDPNLFLNVAQKAMKWNEPAEPAKVVGPIYFVGTKGLGAWLIVTSEGHILLNTGMPGSGKMIAKSIRDLGFDPKDIKLLLSSHAHIDHVGGHAFIEKLSGARVVLMAEGVDLMTSGGKNDFFYRDLPNFEYDPLKVDVVLRDGDTIKLGDVALTALLTQGHCKGATTWTTNVVDNGRIYSVVFPDGSGANPGYRLMASPSYAGIDKDFRDTFHVLESLKPDIWLALHNETYGFKEKSARSVKEGAEAWVDPEGYRKFVVDQRAKFEATINKELGEPPQ